MFGKSYFPTKATVSSVLKTAKSGLQRQKRFLPNTLEVEQSR